MKNCGDANDERRCEQLLKEMEVSSREDEMLTSLERQVYQGCHYFL